MIAFRFANDNDWPGLDALQRECFPPELWSKSANGAIVIAEDAGRIVGAATGRYADGGDAREGRLFELHSVKVSTSHRGAGLGMQLAQHLLAASAGEHRVVTAKAISRGGLALCRSLGMVATGDTVDVN